MATQEGGPHARISPIRHITESKEWNSLSLSARLLAVLMASRLRPTAGGSFVIWRGRKSLARMANLSTKTVSKARRELLEKGLFMARPRLRAITAKDGRVFNVARGVMVLELVLDVAAFLEGRTKAREAHAKTIDHETQIERLGVQRLFLDGRIDRDEMRAREGDVRRMAEKLRRRGVAPSP